MRPWSREVQVPATVVHAVPISFTIFRLVYRCRLSRFSWEDGWATLALLCDMVCLASVWMNRAPPAGEITHGHYAPPLTNRVSNWLLSIFITSVVWFARMSILCSVVRIANPRPGLRRVAYGVGVAFLAMEVGLVAQKIYVCVKYSCRFITSVVVVQLVTDVISDVILVALPIECLRGVNLSQDRRILILSAFSASILITAVTIPHAILLFQDATNTTLIIGHAKAGLALLVCNALVLVTFVYRLYHHTMGADVEAGPGAGAAAGAGAGDALGSRTVELTSVIDFPSKLSFASHPFLVVPPASSATRTGGEQDTS